MPLPDADSLHFERPPVVEVALGVQFETVVGLTGPEIGLYWASRRDQFPRVEEHPPLAPMFEVFPAPRIPGMKIELRVLDRPPSPRYWFLNDRGSELIQIQQDRFMHNWRKMDDDDAYPSYEHLRAAFVRELDGFREFLDRESLGELSVNQCELTYGCQGPTSQEYPDTSGIGRRTADQRQWSAS